MKILIGTPIHEIKDYAMERWLENVARLKYEAVDIFLVENSPMPHYVERVKRYCEKYKIPTVNDLSKPIAASKNCKIEYWGYLTYHLEKHHKIAICNEIIKKEVLNKNYDAWLFWENDVLIPTDALGKLADLMKAGNFEAVFHNCWYRGSPNSQCFDFGLTLISRRILKTHSFLNNYRFGQKKAKSWNFNDHRFKEGILNTGGTYAEVRDLAKPIIHLDK